MTTVLKIIALLITWLTATIGIWTNKNMERRIAKLLTTVATAGLLAGIILSVIEYNHKVNDAKTASEKERSLEEQLRQQYDRMSLVLTGVELKSITLNWKFTHVPKSVMNVFAVSNAIAHAEQLSDDEINRLADRTQDALGRYWLMENTIGPLVAMISSGDQNIHQYFDGQVNEAIKSFGPGAPPINNPDDVWYQVYNRSPDYEIIFPLNIDRTAAFSPGKIADAPAFQSINEEDMDGLQKYLNDRINFSFEVSVDHTANSFTISWKYGADAFKKAVQSSSFVSAALPDSFEFMSLDSAASNYPDILKAGPYSTLVEKGTAPAWMRTSELTVITNDKAGINQTYLVTRNGLYDQMIEYSKYDSPEILFRFCSFTAKLKLPSYRKTEH